MNNTGNFVFLIKRYRLCTQKLKNYIIEELLKVESYAVLAELEIVLTKFNAPTSKRKSFKTFVGSLSEKEVEELEHNIENGCEQIIFR